MRESHPWDDPSNYGQNFDRGLFAPVPGIDPRDFQDQVAYQDALMFDTYRRADEEALRAYQPTQDYNTIPAYGQWASLHDEIEGEGDATEPDTIDEDSQAFDDDAERQERARQTLDEVDRNPIVAEQYRSGTRYRYYDLVVEAGRWGIAAPEMPVAEQFRYFEMQKPMTTPEVLEGAISNAFDRWLDSQRNSKADSVRRSNLSDDLKAELVEMLQLKNAESLVDVFFGTHSKDSSVDLSSYIPAILRRTGFEACDKLVMLYEKWFGKFPEGMSLDAYSKLTDRVQELENLSRRSTCFKELVLIMRFSRSAEEQ